MRNTCYLFVCAVLLVVAAGTARGHAPPTLTPTGALRDRGTQLVDAAGRIILLRGTQISGLNAANPSAAEQETIAALNGFTFGVIRERWNMSALRLPVSPRIWQRDGQAYLNRVAQIVKQANGSDLIVVLAAFEDTGLPNPELAAFWRTWASFFKDSPKVIFDVFDEPSARNVPGNAGNQRSPSDWQFWLRGGVAANGQRVAGMQDLVDAIRSTGAAQPIAVPAFHDSLGFQGFGPDFYIRDPDILRRMGIDPDRGPTWLPQSPPRPRSRQRDHLPDARLLRIPHHLLDRVCLRASQADSRLHQLRPHPSGPRK